MKTSERLEQFKTHITDKYYLYNSLLNHLPYETNKNIGILIPILAQSCHQGFEQGLSPRQIIEGFFERHTDLEDEKDQIDFLFRIIQYIERQIVLFDSVEDSAFGELKKSSSNLSLKDLRQMARSRNMSQALFEKLSDFKVRIVFTAHPTQFYPSSVLRIIHDLQDAISRNAVREINTLLKQLGKTPFLKRTKPTPFEEAQSILYYLRYVYYDAIGEFFEYVDQEVLGKEKFENYRLIELGFWPGGDRDGNPFVTAETTREVAAELRMTLMKCYYNELKVLRRKLTFRGVVEPLETLSDQLYQNMFALDKNLDTQGILSPLLSVREILVRDHYSLYLHELDRLINKVRIFGTHFASLDIRQDSRPHQHIIDRILQFYGLTEDPSIELEKEARIRLLTEASGQAQSEDFEDPLVKDTINNVRQLKDIQRSNGEAGCHRYIISNSGDVFAVLNVVALFKMCGYAEEDIHFDIVPLFETMQAMDDAEQVMRDLFENETYARHLKRRGMEQTIMLGFSDGTKDGGYLKANWEIFNVKERLSRVCAEYGVRVVFFDGRGGPPARGGGKTHRFYASQGANIANHEIHLTIQGQTITSIYGTDDQFLNNCEQLITAGINNSLFLNEKTHIAPQQRKLLDELALLSFQKYTALKQHPKFVPYLEKISPLKYYGKTNIGSRPSRRGKSEELSLSDLRAIPFVGSWSQLKQNVPGYFGLGSALNELKKSGRLQEAKALFADMPFFRALLLNSMMAVKKTFFPLTAYMKEDPDFGDFWQMLYDEYQLSLELMLEVSGFEELMQEEPVSSSSVSVREEIVLPLITIQQHALQKVLDGEGATETYEKLVTRSFFGSINASRNSA